MDPPHGPPMSARGMRESLRRHGPTIRRMLSAPLRFCERQARRLNPLTRLVSLAFARGEGPAGILASARRVVRREGLGGLTDVVRRLHDEIQGRLAAPAPSTAPRG